MLASQVPATLLAAGRGCVTKTENRWKMKRRTKITCAQEGGLCLTFGSFVMSNDTRSGVISDREVLVTFTADRDRGGLQTLKQETR